MTANFNAIRRKKKKMADTAGVAKKLARESTFQSLLAANQDIATKLADLITLETAINGNLGNLKTTTKLNLVVAVNELVNARSNLSALSTSAKDTIVSAITFFKIMKNNHNV